MSQHIKNEGPIGKQININYAEKVIIDGDGRQVPFLAPAKPPYELIGRNKLLSKLKERLFAGNYVALNGLPGVGKTALAVALAHDPDVLKHFEDGVLWAGLGREPDLSALLMQWGVALGVPYEEMAEQKTIGDKKNRVKAAIGTRKMLLVVDDAWDAKAALTFLFGYSNCGHLLTTRQPPIALDFASESGRIKVTELSHDDGLLLLEELAPEAVAANPKAAQELVEAVDGLPLALILMGRYLQKGTYDNQLDFLPDLLSQLRDIEQRLLLEESAARLGDNSDWLAEKSLSLLAIIEISDKALDKTARCMFHALSIFLPKPNTFSSDAASAVSATPTITLKTLTDYGLLESQGGGRYTLHQTIADYATSNRNEDETSLFEQRAATYFAAFAQLHSRSGYNELDKEWLNISHSMEFASKNEQWSTLLEGVQGLTRHNLGVVGFMDARGYWKNARELLPKALEGAKALERAKALDDRQVEASILTKMGAFAFRQSEFDVAEGYFQESLEILEQLPSWEDVLLQRAHCYQFMAELELERNPQAGLEWVERGLTELDALNLKTDVVKPQKGYFYLLSARLSGQMGQVAQVIPAAKKALTLLPHRSSAGITAFRTLSSAYSWQGILDKSLVYQYQQLEVVKELGDSRQIAHSLINIGQDEGNSGNLKVAFEKINQALELYKKMGDVNGKIRAHNQLGMFYIVLSEDEQAKEHLETALDFAKDHQIIQREAFSQTQLASLLIYQEKINEAASALKSAHHICVQHKLDYLRSVVLYWQAEVARKKGQHDQALTRISESLQLTQKGGYLLEEGIAWSIKGKILDAMQRFDEAEDAHQTSLKILGKHYKYDIAQSQRTLGEHYLMCDGEGSKQAKLWLEEALATFERLGAKRDIALTKKLLK